MTHWNLFEVAMDKTPVEIPVGLPDIAQLVSTARATGNVQVVKQVFDGLTVDVRIGLATTRRQRRKTGILATDDPLFQLDRHMPEMSASEAANPPVSSDTYRYLAETYIPPSERAHALPGHSDPTWRSTPRRSPLRSGRGWRAP